LGLWRVQFFKFLVSQLFDLFSGFLDNFFRDKFLFLLESLSLTSGQRLLRDEFLGNRKLLVLKLRRLQVSFRHRL